MFHYSLRGLLSVNSVNKRLIGQSGSHCRFLFLLKPILRGVSSLIGQHSQTVLQSLPKLASGSPRTVPLLLFIISKLYILFERLAS